MSRLLAVAAAGLLMACSDATGLDLGARQRILAELSRNEAKWAAAAITDYRYSFRRVCDCTSETTAAVRVEVRDGSVYRVRLLSTGADIEPGSGFWPTVQELFDEIRLALVEGASSVEVRYDPVYGYPLEIAVAWGAETSSLTARYASELMPIE